ncbi:hypothetical protein D9M69_658800 [compost metagenome]
MKTGGEAKLTSSPMPSSWMMPGSMRSISAGRLEPLLPSPGVTNAAKQAAIFACSITASSISSKLRRRCMAGASQV